MKFWEAEKSKNTQLTFYSAARITAGCRVVSVPLRGLLRVKDWIYKSAALEHVLDHSASATAAQQQPPSFSARDKLMLEAVEETPNSLALSLCRWETQLKSKVVSSLGTSHMQHTKGLPGHTARAQQQCGAGTHGQVLSGSPRQGSVPKLCFPTLFRGKPRTGQLQPPPPPVKVPPAHREASARCAYAHPSSCPALMNCTHHLL